jgi:hypothetical protein
VTLTWPTMPRRKAEGQDSKATPRPLGPTLICSQDNAIAGRGCCLWYTGAATTFGVVLQGNLQRRILRQPANYGSAIHELLVIHFRLRFTALWEVSAPEAKSEIV